MAAKEFTIRAATSHKCFDSAMAFAKEEQWLLGKADSELFYAEDPDGFYIGYSGEEEVSYASMVTYREEYCILSALFVCPKHRGQGYGTKTTELVWSKIPKSVTCKSTCAVESMTTKYQEKYGLEPAWCDYMFEFDSKKVLSLADECEAFDIIPYRDVDFEKLLEYDASVFGYVRRGFLNKLVDIGKGWVTRNSRKEIVGYCAVRESNLEDSGWILGPWYANNSAIAKSLLIPAAKFAESRSDVTSILACFIPEINKEAMMLAESISTPVYGLLRMFTKSKPEVIVNNSKERVFAINSPAFG